MATDERTAAMDALIADSADMIDAPASADAMGEVERVANALANADLDSPDPDDYWTSLATAALAAMPPAGDAEQRGYDRAIAEVVAMLERMAETANAIGGYGDYAAADAFNEVRRAIEAGEHKP